MILLISPAKTFSKEVGIANVSFSERMFAVETGKVLQVMKLFSSEDIVSLMKVSHSIGELNYGRFQDLHSPFTDKNSRQALFSFQGSVYKAMEPEKFSPSQLDYAQKHLRLLSGFYGLLKPLDLIRPYRLEMGKSVSVDGSKNLYDFWSDIITTEINREDQVIINVASEEYFKSVNVVDLKNRLINVSFKELRDGTYRTISTSAKTARGLMIQYIVVNVLEDPEEIKGFNLERYSFNKGLSGDNDFVFSR